MKQALEALKNSQYRLAEYGYQAMQKTIDGNKQAITTLRTAIEQAEKQEPPPECQTEAEKRAFAFGWWKALEANRAAQRQWICLLYTSDAADD